MSHVFISYSRKDTDYAHALAERLQAMGFSVWIDARLDYGSQWPHELQKYLDSCEAFIVIMSPHSFASEWVQGELQRAKRKRKPVFPLLLEGEETWLSVESTQFYDVRNRKLPDDEFYADLKNAISAEHTAQAAPELQTSAKKPKPVKNSQPAIKTVGIYTAIGSFIAVLGVCTVMGILLFRRLDADRAPSFVQTEVDIFTVQPTPPVTTTQLEATMLPVELPEGLEVLMTSPWGSQFQYTILTAQREPLPPDKFLLHLRIRVWTDYRPGLHYGNNSFRLAAGDLRLEPVSFINEVVHRDETVDGDVDFEIDPSLKEAVLVITAGAYRDSWATKELRLVFP